MNIKFVGRGQTGDIRRFMQWVTSFVWPQGKLAKLGASSAAYEHVCVYVYLYVYAYVYVYD